LLSWIARIFSLKNALSRNPAAYRFIVLIWLFVPSRGPDVILPAEAVHRPLRCAAHVVASGGSLLIPDAAARLSQPSRNQGANFGPGCSPNWRRSSFREEAIASDWFSARASSQRRVSAFAWSRCS
jgi:hypothetical protein